MLNLEHLWKWQVQINRRS